MTLSNIMEIKEKETIIVKDIIGSNEAIFYDPLKVDNLLSLMIEYLHNDFDIVIDFNGIDKVDTYFLNATIAILYKYFDPLLIENGLTVVGLSEENMELLQKVKRSSKQFFLKYE